MSIVSLIDSVVVNKNRTPPGRTFQINPLDNADLSADFGGRYRALPEEGGRQWNH